MRCHLMQRSDFHCVQRELHGTHTGLTATKMDVASDQDSSKELRVQYVRVPVRRHFQDSSGLVLTRNPNPGCVGHR